jgi:para-aminobenzoate synthetase component 1
VRVEEMMRLDRRTHVVQAIADIRGALEVGRDAVDVIEAMFPAGSVTGVPKIRAMELLDGLERYSRGPFTGSFGMLAPWGDLDLNVLIRSAWRVGGRLAFSAGGGIVLDSDPRREYEESLAKAEALRRAVESLRA